MAQQIQPQAPAAPVTFADDFDLDVAAVEVADARTWPTRSPPSSPPHPSAVSAARWTNWSPPEC